MDQYKIVKMLGEGGFGKVFLVVDKKGDKYAIKEMNKEKLGRDDPEQLDYIYNEVKIMR